MRRPLGLVVLLLIGLRTGLPGADPILAFLIFREYRIIEDTATGDRKVPRLLQEGRALGPVPLEAVGDGAPQVLDSLLASLEEAREWGWFPSSEAVLRFEERLRGLPQEGFTAGSLESLQRGVEALHRDGEILEEAVILVREYLRHIASL